MKHEYSQRWHFYSPVSCLLVWSLMWSESCSQARPTPSQPLSWLPPEIIQKVPTVNHTIPASSACGVWFDGSVWTITRMTKRHVRVVHTHSSVGDTRRYACCMRASDQKGLTWYLEPKPGNKQDIKLGSSRGHKYFVTTGVKSTALVDFTHQAFQCFNLIQNVSAQYSFLLLLFSL